MILRKSLNLIFISLIIISVWIFVFPLSSDCQINVRDEINFPDILNYKTLKCDFHIHTVFSDGNVWPHIRTAEAWREGLDAFSITDHIEYQPHDKDVSTDHNRSYQLALPSAKSLDLILIKGSEITRDMPPGHLNAIFINDSNPLDTEKYEDAIKNAVEQGGFVFWNHPPFPQPQGKSVWYPEHENLYKKGLMMGIEVANGRDYYPKAHKWCLEKNITMIGTSDIHNPINFDYDIRNGEHRTMTLVFAEKRTAEAIKNALRNRRTTVYYRNFLYGEEKYLKPLFYNSIKIKNHKGEIKGKNEFYFQIYNDSDINYKLTTDIKRDDLSFPQSITLYAEKTVIFRVRGKNENLTAEKKIEIPYTVQNLQYEPDKGIPVTLKFQIKFIPKN